MGSKRKLERNDENLFRNEENLENIFTNGLQEMNLSESEAELENEDGNKNEIELDDENDEWEDIDSDYDSDVIEDADSDDVVGDDEDELEDEEEVEEKGKKNHPQSIKDKEGGHHNRGKISNRVDIKEQRKSGVDNNKQKTRKKRTKKNSNNKQRESGVDNKTEADKSISDQTSYNEYEYDSSDEEDLRNTIGNIPINWYDEYEHLGYGLDSLPIYKPEEGDTLDKFLDKLENPDSGRTVFDKQTGQRVRLSDHHLDLVRRLMKGKVPDPQYNSYQPFLDLYSHEVMEMALSGRQEHKKSFLPVKSERQKVARLAYLIKNGWYKRINKPKKEETKYYDLWKPRSSEEPPLMGISDHIPAPKVPLPGHGDSYNPPPEYLLSKKDEKIIKGEANDGILFKRFWRKYSSIREIPAYPKTLTERYNRLLDLYCAPRKRYQKVVAEAKDFLPKLPDKKDLRPYPTLEGLRFEGHRSIVRTISIHPNGKYLASGSDDHTVRIWEVSTGRCLRTFEVEEVVQHVSWNPSNKLFLLGIAIGKMVVFLNPETYLTDKIVVQQTNSIFKLEVEQGDYIAPERIAAAITWRKPTENEWQKGYRVVLDHFKEVREIVWHRQGDYFATVIPGGIQRSVILHQLSKWRSQLILGKVIKGIVQRVAFHPKEPLLYVTTQTSIHIFNLKRQCRIKKVQANSRYISCIAVHPGGEHFIIGGYDRRINWFEMECTKRPHLMRFHGSAVRSVKYHRKYPLFASCSDDRKLIVTHGTVYDDLLKDPLIVPLKQLKGHKIFDSYYVLDVEWHPYEPYLFSAGADATIRLWH